MEIIPVRREQNGKLIFRVNYDHMPEGFLDCIDESDFTRLCQRDQAFTEACNPVIDDHIDPRIALMRLRQIHADRVCGVIRVFRHDIDGFDAELAEHGPHAHLLNYLDNIKKLFIAPRLIFNEDRQVINIITFDVIEVN